MISIFIYLCHNKVCLNTNINTHNTFNPTKIQMHFYALELTSYFSLACTKLYFPFLTTINTYSKLKSILSNKVPY